MKYKIGEAARMLGVSPDLLRHYEKKGLVHPEKDAENNYRYYEAWDISTLIECLWYRKFDFSIDEIAGIVAGDDYKELTGRLAEKEMALEASIHRQQLLQRALRQHHLDMRRGRENLWQCDVTESESVLCYMNRHNFAYDEDPALTGLTQAWLQYMPFARRCFEIRLPDLLREDGEENFSWGLSITAEYGKEFPILAQEPVKILEPLRCVHGYFKSTGKQAFSPDKLKFIVDYAKENGYTLCGSAHGNLLCSVAEDGGQTGYFEVWIPIE